MTEIASFEDFVGNQSRIYKERFKDLAAAIIM